MPIDRETFEDITDDRQQIEPKPTHAEQVQSFLADHEDEAFTPTELREALSVPRGSIGTTLARLEDRGQVVHRGAYWAIASADATPDDD